jgi:hypothetical protein
MRELEEKKAVDTGYTDCKRTSAKGGRRLGGHDSEEGYQGADEDRSDKLTAQPNGQFRRPRQQQ